MREALETHVVRTAKVTPAMLVDLQQGLKRQRAFLKANDRTHYIEEDLRFHAVLAGATGNAHLCAVLENFQNQIWLARRKTYDLSSTAAPDQHQAILDAFAANQRAKAESAMREHIQHIKHRLVAFLESREMVEKVG